jgi:hypothetical protein
MRNNQNFVLASSRRRKKPAADANPKTLPLSNDSLNTEEKTATNQAGKTAKTKPSGRGRTRRSVGNPKSKKPVFFEKLNSQGLNPTDPSTPSVISDDTWSKAIQKRSFPVDSEDHLAAECSIEYVRIDISGVKDSIVAQEMEYIFGDWVNTLSRYNYASEFGGLGNDKRRRVLVDKLRVYFNKVVNFHIIYMIYSQMYSYDRMPEGDTSSAIKQYCGDCMRRIGGARSKLSILKANNAKALIPPTIISYISKMFGFKTVDNSANGVLHKIKGVQIFIAREDSDGKTIGGKVFNFPPVNKQDTQLFNEYLKEYVDTWVPADIGTFDVVAGMLKRFVPSWSLEGQDLVHDTVPVMDQWVYDMYHNLPVPTGTVVDTENGLETPISELWNTNYRMKESESYFLMFPLNGSKDAKPLLFSLRTEEERIPNIDYFEGSSIPGCKFKETVISSRPAPGIITRLPIAEVDSKGDSPIRFVLSVDGKILPITKGCHKMTQAYRFDNDNGQEINISTEQRVGFTIPSENFHNDLRDILKHVFGDKDFQNSDYFKIIRNTR